MKTDKTLLNKKSLVKATSGLLSLLLTANAGLNLLSENVSARSITYANGSVLIQSDNTSGFEDFAIKYGNGTYYMTTSYYSDTHEKDITNNCNFVLEHNCTLSVYTGYSFGTIILSAKDTTFKVNNTGDDDGSVSWNTIQGCGNNTEVIVYGTLELDEFYVSTLASDGITEFHNGLYGSNGVIVADSVRINNDIYSDIEGSEIHVADSFICNQNINSTVYADRSTTITNVNGSFKLKVGDAEKLITESCDRESAYSLFDDPSLSLGNLPQVYYGQNYDFSSLVSTASGYDKSKVYLEYSYNGSEVLAGQPTAVGNYYVRAVAPDDGSYLGTTTAWKSYSISYLPLSTLFPSDDSYFTISGTVNGKYVPDALVLTPPRGIQIGCPTSSRISGYSTSVSLTEDDIYMDGHINEDFEIGFARTSDGATTQGRAISYFISDIEDYVFDPYDPHFSSFIRESEIGYLETSLEDNVVANEVLIKVYDDNLSKVVMNNNGTTTDLSSTISGGYCNITLYGKVAEKQEIKITAYDMANRSTEVEFTLYHEPVDPTLTVDFPARFYAGEVYEPEVTTNSDGDVTVSFYDGDEEIEYPLTSGNYTVVVSVDDTDYYNGKSIEKSFSVIKRTTTASVTVSDIMVGGTVNPVLTTNSNAKDEAVYEYKLVDESDSEYSETVPEAAGKYIVRVTIPASVGYEEQTCTATFTISKYPLYATVSVADIIIGNQVSPVINVTNEDYNGTEEAVIEYKLSNESDSEYSETIPTAAGKYTVRVTLPETYAYKGTTCKAEFEIKKMVVTATVTIADLYVGKDVKPVVSTSSDGKDDTVYEYKLINDPDTKYSTAVPAAAGSYSVRATVPATDRYAQIVCYDTFIISLNPVKVETFKVADLYVGQFASPEFKSDSDGVVSFMYKPVDDPDTSYTTITPTAAGKYMVRATVQRTATYEIGVFTTTFTISYLDTPSKAYTPVGTAGKEGYFTSDVELTAPEGYSISATPNGVYAKSITYTDGMSTVYLKRDDGARTAAITITNKPKIDKNAPKFTSTSGSLAQGSVMYTSNVNVKIDEQNLTSLTLNGVPVDLKSIPGNVLALSPGMGVKKFVIVAEDIAGNVSTIEFTLKAEWLENKIIPADEVLPLESSEEYNLDEGHWTVTRNTTDNSGDQKPDTTVYNGNIPVYVNEDGDYTFTKVN